MTVWVVVRFQPSCAWASLHSWGEEMGSEDQTKSKRRWSARERKGRFHGTYLQSNVFDNVSLTD